MTIFIRLVLGTLALVVLVGGALLVASQQTPRVAQGLSPVPTSAAAMRSFESKVQQLDEAVAQAKKTGTAQRVQVSFSEQELTSMAAEAAASQSSDGIQAQNTQVHLAGNQIIATSTVTVSGISMNVGVVAVPTVVNGQTQIVVQQIQTGAIPLPDAIRNRISAQIGAALDPSKIGLPISVSEIQIVNGQLVISGTAKP